MAPTMPLADKPSGSSSIVPIPSRVRVAVAYPIRDASGLAPILLGHESGVTIRWSAIDEDKTQKIQQPSFDFALGSQVLDVAIPPINVLAQSTDSSSCPKEFKENIIAAVACADSTVKIILLPLLHPASQESNSSQPYGSVVAEIHHQQDAPNLVSMTWTEPRITSQTQPSHGATDNSHQMDTDGPSLSLLVASASRDANTFLSITRVTLNIAGNKITLQKGARTPFQRVRIPTTPIRLSFNPSAVPSATHSQVLVVGRDGLVYVYDPFQRRSAQRGLTRASSASSKDPLRGSWLASFTTKFTGFTDDATESPYLAHRKRILDAQWAANGSAIVALLSDGEWGVWDVYGARPNKTGTYDPASFALWGMVAASVPSHRLQSQGLRKSLEPSNFLPTMTPNTRKLKAETLFSGSTVSADSSSTGGIVVTRVPLPSADNTEDTITFWYNNSICFIESLQAYWSRAAKRSEDSRLSTSSTSLFGPSLTRIDGLDLQGQTITSVSQLPAPIGTSSNSRTVAVTTEHQIVFSGRTVERGLLSGTSKILSRPSRTSGSLTNNIRALIPGMNLDIDSMDAVLDSMENGGDISMSGALVST